MQQISCHRRASTISSNKKNNTIAGYHYICRVGQSINRNAAMKDNSLKIGLLTNDRIIPDWVFDCLNKIRQSSFAELSLIVLKHSGSDQSKHFQSNDYRPSLIFSLYSRFEHLAFRPKPNAFEPKNIDALGLERLPQVLLYPNSPAGHNPINRSK